MVRFPREDGADVVTVRGPSAIAERIRTEIEAQVAALRNRVVVAVVVPRSLHASIIGRGGSAVNELQRKHGVKVLLPGWQEHSASPGAINASELEGVAPEDVVRLLGPQPACEEVAQLLRVRHKLFRPPSCPIMGHAYGKLTYFLTLVCQSRSQSSRNGRASGAVGPLTRTIMVPRRLHARIAEGGRFFRRLPPGTRIDHGDIKPPSSYPPQPKKATNGVSSASEAARIDQDVDERSDGFHWEVSPVDTDDEAEIPW
jgi:KH domain